MLEEADRLSGLVDRLLTVSRADTGDPCANATRDRSGGSRRQRCWVTLACSPRRKSRRWSFVRNGSPTCRGDRIVLRQALINLVDNAIRYTPPRGEIRVRVVGRERRVRSWRSRDTGPGIPEQHAPRTCSTGCIACAGSEVPRVPDESARMGATEPVSGLPSPVGPSRPTAGGSATSGSQGSGSIFRITLPGGGREASGCDDS